MSNTTRANLAHSCDDMGEEPEAFQFIEDNTPTAFDVELELAHRENELSKYSIEELQAEIDRRQSNPAYSRLFDNTFGNPLDRFPRI